MRAAWSTSALLTVALAVPGAAVADNPSQPVPLFHTPGNAAFCVLGTGGFEPANPVLKCWTPNDGFTVSVAFDEPRANAFWRKSYRPANRGRTPHGYRLLAFGQRRRVYCDVSGASVDNCLRGGADVAFTCTSRRTGLTCRNRAGRGFWLGRYVGYRLF